MCVDVYVDVNLLRVDVLFGVDASTRASVQKQVPYCNNFAIVRHFLAHPHAHTVLFFATLMLHDPFTTPRAHHTLLLHVTYSRNVKSLLLSFEATVTSVLVKP